MDKLDDKIEIDVSNSFGGRDLKCGEIYRNQNEFYYKCEFCEEIIQNSIELFNEHYFQNHHNSTSVETHHISIVKVEEKNPFDDDFIDSEVDDNDYVSEKYSNDEDELLFTKRKNKLKTISKSKKNKSKPRKDWIEERIFRSRKEAEKIISNENTWSASYKQTVKKGNKQYYRCNQVLVRGKQCAAQIFLLNEKNSKKTKLFRSIDQHNCKDIQNERKYQKFNKNFLSDEVKLKIQKLFEQELSPIVIYETLKNDYAIKVRQISNYLVTLRSKFGTKNPQLRSEITTWLSSIKNSKDCCYPKNFRKPFVVANTDNEHEFRLFISSKRLLYNCLKTDNLNAFGMKKITWKGYFLHIVGSISQKTDSFHPFGIAVCPSNKFEDFNFIFESLAAGCSKVFKNSPNFRILIRDSCIELQNAFESFYGHNPIESRICWDYAKRKIKRKLDEFLQKDDINKKKLLSDLDNVHQSENETEFQERFNQFIDTWSMCVKFITYLYQEWGIESENKNWYRFYNNVVKNSNNSLRIFIHELENDETFRERLPVEQFREKMFEWITNWSNNESKIELLCSDDDDNFDSRDNEINNENQNWNLDDSNQVNSSLKEIVALVERKRQKKVGKQWKIEKIFQSKLEAEEAINSEGYWGSMFKNKTKAGLKVFYRCKKVISRGKQCEAALSLLFKSDSTDVILMRSGLEHTCHKIGLKQKGIEPAIKLKIEELFEMNYKPKNILDHLRENGTEPLPTIMQLNNYLNVIREGRYGSKSVDMNQIEIWLNKNSNLPPNLTKMFVATYEIKEFKFRFFLTSRKLLQNAINLTHIQIDSTNKLEWIKYPIYILGYTDQWNKFQCLGIGICQSNEFEDFKFLFKSLKDSTAQIFNFVVNPKVLITDTCQNIHNAFLNIFGENSKIKICSSFVKKDLKKKAAELIMLKDVTNGILGDLIVIQKSSNSNEFQLNLKNFGDKWNSVANEFVQYFQLEYCSGKSVWYDDYEPHVPKNNNSLEQIVKALKNEDKQRKKISLTQLEIKLSKWIETWSNSANLLYKLEIS